MIVAKHRPKMGDVIYSLPLLRDMRRTCDVTLLLDPDSPHFPDKVELWRDKLFPQAIEYLRGLPYLDDVRLYQAGEHFDVDLDSYMNTSHQRPGDSVSIVENHFVGLGRQMPEGATEPWLVPVVAQGGVRPHPFRCLVSHSGRYVNQGTSWRFLRHAPEDEWGFVGYEEECDFFCHRAGIKGAPLVVCEDLMRLVYSITHCEVFMGNQSLPLAIALGLGKKCFVEESTDFPNCRVGNYARLP